jgi:hypothetical protein
VAESWLYFAEARLPEGILAAGTGDGRVHPRQIDHRVLLERPRQDEAVTRRAARVEDAGERRMRVAQFQERDRDGAQPASPPVPSSFAWSAGAALPSAASRTSADLDTSVKPEPPRR